MLKVLSNAEIYKAYKYIESMDRNADVIELYIEYTIGEMPYEEVIGNLQSIFNEWKEDMIFNGLDETEKEILDMLEIKYESDYKILYQETKKEFHQIETKCFHANIVNEELLQENEDLRLQLESVLTLLKEYNTSVEGLLETLEKDGK